MNGRFPEDSDARKEYPVYSGFLQYFPAAIAAIAHHSYKGNQKHNPGQPLHHDRAKSGDEPDALTRHLMEDDLVGMEWSEMSMRQKHLEATGAPQTQTARTTPAPKIRHDVAKPMTTAGDDNNHEGNRHTETQP